MDATRPSSPAPGCHHRDLWRKIETSLEVIQIHCNELLSHYPRLSSQQVIALIEVIEIQNFLLQEWLAQIAPASPMVDRDEDQE